MCTYFQYFFLFIFVDPLIMDPSLLNYCLFLDYFQINRCQSTEDTIPPWPWSAFLSPLSTKSKSKSGRFWSKDERKGVKLFFGIYIIHSFPKHMKKQVFVLQSIHSLQHMGKEFGLTAIFLASQCIILLDIEFGNCITAGKSLRVCFENQVKTK